MHPDNTLINDTLSVSNEMFKSYFCQRLIVVNLISDLIREFPGATTVRRKYYVFTKIHRRSVTSWSIARARIIYRAVHNAARGLYGGIKYLLRNESCATFRRVVSRSLCIRRRGRNDLFFYSFIFRTFSIATPVSLSPP